MITAPIAPFLIVVQASVWGVRIIVNVGRSMRCVQSVLYRLCANGVAVMKSALLHLDYFKDVIPALVLVLRISTTKG